MPFGAAESERSARADFKTFGASWIPNLVMPTEARCAARAGDATAPAIGHATAPAITAPVVAKIRQLDAFIVISPYIVIDPRRNKPKSRPSTLGRMPYDAAYTVQLPSAYHARLTHKVPNPQVTGEYD